MENAATLEAFLAWLGQNRASGAREYEDVRRKLIILFRYRGCPNPEEMADETIDRTSRAVTRPGFQLEGAPVSFIRGVARNVYLEWLRNERRHPTEPLPEEHSSLQAPSPADEEEELVSACLESCLTRLPPPKRDLLLQYYRHDGAAKIDARQKLAEQQGLGLNALRIQVFRLRNLVRDCVEECRKRNEIEGLARPSGN